MFFRVKKIYKEGINGGQRPIFMLRYTNLDNIYASRNKVKKIMVYNNYN